MSRAGFQFVLWLAVASIGLCVGCSKAGKQSEQKKRQPAALGEMSGARQAPGMRPDHPAEAYRCAQDADCIRTCAQGVVNGAWHKANLSQLSQCKDGCAGPDQLTLKCVHKQCVGLKGDGKVDQYCSHKKIEWAMR